MNFKKILVGSAAGALMLGATIAPAFAVTSVVYNNVPDPIPGNVPSVGFEATSTSEWGGQMQLVGTDRIDPTVTVLMSSWGCVSGTWYGQDGVTSSGATFTHPVTLNVYNVGSGDSVGSLITAKTVTFTMPYRPSASASCTGGDAGKWFDGTTCYNGKAFPISFDLTGTTLPDKVIIGVAYNTTNYGSSAIGTAACGTNCPYDSLNVGTNPTPSVGTALPTANDAYLNSSWSGAYCNGALGTGTFRLDAGCWTGYLPAIKIEANPTLVPAPTDKNQCKNDGWKTFNDPAFKNQGDCVSFVQSNPNAVGNKTK